MHPMVGMRPMSGMQSAMRLPLGMHPMSGMLPWTFPCGRIKRPWRPHGFHVLFFVVFSLLPVGEEYMVRLFHFQIVLHHPIREPGEPETKRGAQINFHIHVIRFHFQIILNHPILEPVEPETTPDHTTSKSMQKSSNMLSKWSPGRTWGEVLEPTSWHW